MTIVASPSTSMVMADRSLAIVDSVAGSYRTQILVRFELLHRTFIIPAPATNQWNATHREGYLQNAILYQLRRLVLRSDTEDPFLAILQQRCRPSDLLISQWHPPFVSCAWRHGPLRGGKGGFGTLLKGQSRQSSAHTTQHFHDCRNLQGQRLRHVNEQIHYELWKEWHAKVQAGTATEVEMVQALTHTATGIAGWHLQLPAWAEVSVKKEQKQNQKRIQLWVREQTQRKEQQQQQRERSEQQIASYVQTANQANEQLERTLESALQQGLRRHREKRSAQDPVHKRPRMETGESNDIAEHVEAAIAPPPPYALVTLSGEASITQSDGTESWTIQGLSNFCTVGILLDASKYHTAFQSRKDDDAADSILYYEVVVLSGTGVVQVGWARSGETFQPNSDTGDGVGDCTASWGYDPSRAIKLHAGISESYGSLVSAAQNESDAPASHVDIRDIVVGCGWNVRTGEFFFSLNRQSLGTAFSVGGDASSSPPVYPVLSCNEGETVQIRLDAKEMEYAPPSAVAVGVMLAEEAIHVEQNGSTRVLEDQVDLEQKPKAVEATPLPSVADSTINNAVSASAPISAPSESLEMPSLPEDPLDLTQFASAQELEALGLERLKRELVSVGLKCGGTLSERAIRLFAIRGLDPKDYPMKLRATKASN